MTEAPKKKRGRPPKPKRRTKYVDPSSYKKFERLVRNWLVAMNVARAGNDHIADLETVDERAEEIIDMINEYRGLS
jgi:hypothetical protein